jgi:two-component system sensor histidine kinase YesM
MNKQQDIITLKDEIENVQSYAIIQKARYSESFEIIYDIQEELLQCRTLKLILQPFVENAILHNTAEISQTVVIKVMARKANDLLELAVEDNGRGIPEDRLENLLTTSNEHKNSIFKGIGINNVNQRIKLKYGSQYGVTISSTLNVGTKITITHPIKE